MHDQAGEKKDRRVFSCFSFPALHSAIVHEKGRRKERKGRIAFRPVNGKDPEAMNGLFMTAFSTSNTE